MTMGRCNMLFMNGRFKESKLCLSKLTFNKFDIQEWIKESNILACEVKEEMLSHETSVASINLLNCFQVLLDKMQGTPVQPKSLETELVVTSNLCHLLIMRYLKGLPPDHGLVLKIFNKTLCRVNKFLGNPARTSSISKEENVQAMVDVITQLSLESKQLTDNLLWSLVQVIAELGLQLLLMGKVTYTVKLLEWLLHSTEKLSLKSSSNLFSISIFGNDRTFLPIPDSGYESNRLEIVMLVLALVYLKLGDQQKYAKLVDSISGQHVFPYAKYIEASMLFNSGDFTLAQKSLSEISDRDWSSGMRAVIHHLTGKCFVRRGKHHCAIQKFKESLKEDFDFLLSLYEISQQYQALQQDDAELEALNLLVTALQHPKETNTYIGSDGFPSDLDMICLKVSGQRSKITKSEALYALAKRCKELRRFDAAGEKYQDLLNFLYRNHFCGHNLTSGTLIVLPPMRQMYHEAISCLLECCQYEEALSLCDRLIQKYTRGRELIISPSSTQSALPSQNPCSCRLGNDSHNKTKTVSESGTEFAVINQTLGESREGTPIHSQARLGDSKDVLPTRKRPRSESSSSGTDKEDLLDGHTVRDLDIDVVAYMYKGKALAKLDQTNRALECLQCVIQNLEESPVDDSSHSSGVIPPKSKKRKVNLDNSSLLIPVERLGVKEMLAEAYWRKGNLLESQNKQAEAFHCSRLAVQLQPEDCAIMYHHVQLLLKLGRNLEAAQSWLRYRNIDWRMEGFQIDCLLKKKKSEIRDIIKNGFSSKDDGHPVNFQFAEMEIRSLEILQKLKQTGSLQ